MSLGEEASKFLRDTMKLGFIAILVPLEYRSDTLKVAIISRKSDSAIGVTFHLLYFFVEL